MLYIFCLVSPTDGEDGISLSNDFFYVFKPKEMEDNSEIVKYLAE